jgi:hypothetical protein
VVIRRAFGRHLLAADDETAARLSAEYGLSCATLAGAVSHRGSLSGGWAGAGAGGSSRLALWRLKAQTDMAQVSGAAACSWACRVRLPVAVAAAAKSV